MYASHPAPASEQPLVTTRTARPAALAAAACALIALLGVARMHAAPEAAVSEEPKPPEHARALEAPPTPEHPDAEKPLDEGKSHPTPMEESTATHHQVVIANQQIPYTATAGNLLIRKEDAPVASMFYVAYTRDDVKDHDDRPVTFCYNGGPGSASIWLHLGSFGPRRVETVNAGPTGPAPYHVVNNEDSLLDRTDLVFIDAIGTGFSEPVGKGKGKDFWGVDGDVDAFAKFITRYLTVNHRWNSPKFLFGESYGTTRSAALVYALQEQGVSCNGVILLSTVLDMATVFSPQLDEPFENTLPTYAAIAWFHHRLPHPPADLNTFLAAVRDFSTGAYAQALAKGDALPPAQFEAVANQLHEYTGLSVAYIKENNLRLPAGRFRKELLRDQRRTVGRYDGRFEGYDFDAAGENPDSDPSETAIAGAFTAAFHSYLQDELKFSSDKPYTVMGRLFMKWDWTHKLPAYLSYPFPYPFAFVVSDLGQAMRENPGLRVFSANGYFDLATPFFGTERDLHHMQLEPALRDHLAFGYYPSGHMVYLNPEARHAFRADLVKFYDTAAPAR